MARPDVVLTHYPPSPADLSRLEKPVAWLHGHLHSIRNDRAGCHQCVRMPARRDIDLVGAIVTFHGAGLPCRVEPVVGLRLAVTCVS